MKYKKIIERKVISGVAEECEDYYLGNVSKKETNINNEHDKIFRKILSNKQEVANFINKTLKLKKTIKSEQLEKYNSNFITEKLQNRESDVIYKIKGKKYLY